MADDRKLLNFTCPLVSCILIRCAKKYIHKSKKINMRTLCARKVLPGAGGISSHVSVVPFRHWHDCPVEFPEKIAFEEIGITTVLSQTIYFLFFSPFLEGEGGLVTMVFALVQTIRLLSTLSPLPPHKNKSFFNRIAGQQTKTLVSLH